MRINWPVAIPIVLMALYSGSTNPHLCAAPPVLTVSPPSPKPGDPVFVSSPVASTFDVRGSAEVTKHGQRAITFTMPAAGGVVVLASAGKTASPADTAVVLIGAGLPGPNPPPVPPGPSDAVKKLAADFAAALKLDPPAQKALVPALAKVWRESGTAIDQAKKWGELEDELRKRFTAAGTAGNLINLQTAIAKVLLAKIPGLDPNASEVVLDAVGKATAKELFTLVADALALVK